MKTVPRMRPWPLRTILEWDGARFRVLGYVGRGTVVKLGRLTPGSVIIEWQFRRSVAWVAEQLAQRGAQS